MIYLQYVEPFIVEHEREIEDFVTKSHEQAKAAGLQYFYQAVEIIREKLGYPPVKAAPPQSAGTGATGYAQSLLSRFSLQGTPASAASSSGGAPGTDFYSLLSSAVTSVTSTGQSRDSQAEELSASGSLLPRDIASAPKSEQARYISSQREKLSVLLSAFDREQTNLGRDSSDPLAYGDASGLRKNKSEVSFENIEHDDAAHSSANEGIERRKAASGGGVGGIGVDFAQRSVEEIAKATGAHLGR